jgi:hypothetical protein
MLRVVWINYFFFFFFPLDGVLDRFYILSIVISLLKESINEIINIYFVIYMIDLHDFRGLV